MKAINSITLLTKLSCFSSIVAQQSTSRFQLLSYTFFTFIIFTLLSTAPILVSAQGEFYTNFGEVYDCDNNNYGVRMQVFGIHPPFEVTWGESNTFVADDSFDEIVYGFQPGQYTFIVKDDNNDSESINVTINEKEVLKGCEDECITMEREPSNAHCTYWQSKDYTISDEEANGLELEVCPNPGSYVFEVIDVDEDGNTSIVKAVKVTIVSKEVMLLPPLPVVCLGSEVKLYLANSETYLSYKWSTEETTPSVYVSLPGTYSVTVTTDNGCEVVGDIEVLDEDNSGDAIKQMFIDNGFVYLPILEDVTSSIQQPNGQVDRNKLLLACPTQFSSLTNYTNEIIFSDEYATSGSASDDPLNVYEYLTGDCDENSYIESYYYSDNTSFCENLEETLSKFSEFNKSTAPSVWIHIYDDGFEKSLVIKSNFIDTKRHFLEMEGLDVSSFLELDEIPELEVVQPWQELTFKKFYQFSKDEGIDWKTFKKWCYFKQYLGRVLENTVSGLLGPAGGYPKFVGGLYTNGDFFSGRVTPPANLPRSGYKVPDFIDDVQIDYRDLSTGEINKMILFPWHRGGITSTSRHYPHLSPASLIEVKSNQYPPLPYAPTHNPLQISTYFEYMNHTKLAM
jgi:hypothetical protein